MTVGYASVQYVVEHLGVQLIVVLGDSGCGGVVKRSSTAVEAPGHLGNPHRGASSLPWMQPPPGPATCCKMP